MVRTHPQWLRARTSCGPAGSARCARIVGTFSYFNATPVNVRNMPAYGGGALLDIGCYLVNTARMLFGRTPAGCAPSSIAIPYFASTG